MKDKELKLLKPTNLTAQFLHFLHLNWVCFKRNV